MTKLAGAISERSSRSERISRTDARGPTTAASLLTYDFSRRLSGSRERMRISLHPLDAAAFCAAVVNFSEEFFRGISMSIFSVRISVVSFLMSHKTGSQVRTIFLFIDQELMRSKDSLSRTEIVAALRT